MKTDWFTGIAVTAILIGIFSFARVMVNMAVLSEYPTYGAWPLPGNNTQLFVQTEADCQSLKPYPDSTLPDDLKMQQTEYDKENCFRSVMQTRNQARDMDISYAAFFLLVGLGMLFFRKFLPKLF